MSTKKKILIMEDEKPMARALELKLVHAGFDAKAGFNGEDGVLLMRKEHYDLALLDLVMPKIDGFKVLEILKNENIGIPVIVLSNLSQEGDERRAKELGAKDFFIKSNTPITTIVEHVTQFLK